VVIGCMTVVPSIAFAETTGARNTIVTKC